jgi:hypothetical protein
MNENMMGKINEGTHQRLVMICFDSLLCVMKNM